MHQICEMDLVKLLKNNRVNFHSYRQRYLYYSIIEPETNIEYQFPVPVEDVGSATLLGNDVALLYMRWIRKAINDKTFVKLV